MNEKLTIFLAEDNPADAFLIHEVLASSALTFELERVADGEAALRKLEEIGRSNEAPNLILLDLNLPKISGHELLEYVRSSETLKATPVIILTSSDSPSDRARAAALNVQHYFRKPSTFDEFLGLGLIIEEVCRPRGDVRPENAATG